MKLLLLLATIVLVTACSDRPMNDMFKAKQDYACKDNGGVYAYSQLRSYGPTCQDGTRQDGYLMDVVLPPEYYPKNRNEENE